MGAALFVTTVTSFLTPLMGSALNLALPAIGKEFGLDAVTLGWIPTAYLLAAAIFLIPFGRLGDIYGRKRIYASGVVLYTVSSLLCGLAPSAAGLIGLRVAQGLGASMVFSTAMAILTSATPADMRGRVIGINTASVYAGLTCGPVVGGFLTQHHGWRSVFFLNVPLGIIILAVLLWKLRDEWAEARGERFDIPGSVLFGVSLVALIWGLSRLPGAAGIACVAGGLAGLAGFVVWQTRVRSPLVDVGLFRRNRVFGFSNLATLINYATTSAVGFLVSLYLQTIKDFSPRDAGLVMLSQPVIMALFSPLAGRLSDRIEPGIVSSAGMTFCVTGLAMFAFIGSGTSIGFIVAALVVMGLGFALFSAPNTNAIMSSVEKKTYGVASATLSTMRLTGQMLSMGLTMMIFALRIGRVEIEPPRYPAFVGAARIVFVMFAALCFAGIFASLVRGKVRPGPAEKLRGGSAPSP